MADEIRIGNVDANIQWVDQHGKWVAYGSFKVTVVVDAGPDELRGEKAYTRAVTAATELRSEVQDLTQRGSRTSATATGGSTSGTMSRAENER